MIERKSFKKIFNCVINVNNFIGIYLKQEEKKNLIKFMCPLKITYQLSLI